MACVWWGVVVPAEGWEVGAGGHGILFPRKEDAFGRFQGQDPDPVLFGRLVWPLAPEHSECK